MDAQAQIATLPAGPPETSIEPRTIRPELLPLPPDDDSQPHSSTYSLRTLNVHRAPTATATEKVEEFLDGISRTRPVSPDLDPDPPAEALPSRASSVSLTSEPATPSSEIAPPFRSSISFRSIPQEALFNLQEEVSTPDIPDDTLSMTSDTQNESTREDDSVRSIGPHSVHPGRPRKLTPTSASLQRIRRGNTDGKVAKATTSALGPTGTVRKAARPPLDSELGDSEVFEQEGNINNGWVSVKNPNSVNFTSDDEMSIVASDAGVAFSPPSDSFLSEEGVHLVDRMHLE